MSHSGAGADSGKTNELSFGICFYNDPSIFRLLNSLPRECKKILVDGKFKFNGNPKELSDDIMRQQILNYDNVILIDAPNLPEPRKRDKYLIDNESKYLIVIDSDEYIVAADWDKFYNHISKLDHGIHDIFFEVDANGGVTSYPRLWVHPNEWRYTMCHNIFKHQGGELVRSGMCGGTQCPGLMCSMNDDMRDENQLIETSLYQGKMMQFEAPYREQFRNGDTSSFA